MTPMLIWCWERRLRNSSGWLKPLRTLAGPSNWNRAEVSTINNSRRCWPGKAKQKRGFGSRGKGLGWLRLARSCGSPSAPLWYPATRLRRALRNCNWLLRSGIIGPNRMSCWEQRWRSKAGWMRPPTTCRRHCALHPATPESSVSWPLSWAPNIKWPKQSLTTPRPCAWSRAAHPQAEFRDGAEAVRLAERACQVTTNKEPMMIGTLATAYAEAGRFEEAVATASKAQQPERK